SSSWTSPDSRAESLPAVRQKFHLTPCAKIRDHLSGLARGLRLREDSTPIAMRHAARPPGRRLGGSGINDSTDMLRCREQFTENLHDLRSELLVGVPRETGDIDATSSQAACETLTDGIYADNHHDRYRCRGLACRDNLRVDQGHHHI